MQPFGEELMVQVEVEVGELGSGPGIVAAAMPIDELLILTGMRKVSVPRKSMCSRKWAIP